MNRREHETDAFVTNGNNKKDTTYRKFSVSSESKRPTGSSIRSLLERDLQGNSEWQQSATRGWLVVGFFFPLPFLTGCCALKLNTAWKQHWAANEIWNQILYTSLKINLLRKKWNQDEIDSSTEQRFYASINSITSKECDVLERR